MDAALGVDRNLLLEHEAAIDASRAPAMQRLIEQGGGVPLGREAAGRLVTDGNAGKSAEFFLDDAAPLAWVRRAMVAREAR